MRYNLGHSNLGMSTIVEKKYCMYYEASQQRALEQPKNSIFLNLIQSGYSLPDNK